MEKVIYLAGSYEHLGRERAVPLHRRAAQYLLQEGYNVISPILHANNILHDKEDMAFGNFWEELEEKFILISDAIGIIITPEAFLSNGVNREVTIGIRLKKPIFYIIPIEETFAHTSHFRLMDDMFEFFNLNKNDEVKEEEECQSEECLEEKSNPQEKETSMSLAKLLDKMKTGWVSHS